MRGRKPSGPAFVEKLRGSAFAKLRLQVTLETLAGTCRVLEACERLGISEQRFDQIRVELLQAALDSLEPRPAGRPPMVRTEAEVEVERLRERIAQLEGQLAAASIRLELAATLPQAGASAEKKMATGRRRGRPPRAKMSS